MALRATPAQVKEILDTTLSEPELLPFLLAASTLVDTYLGTSSLAVGLLREMERWWAAHLVCVRDPRFTQITTDGQAMTFQRGPAREGLQSTSYGQQVLLFDSTGILAQQLGSKRARVFVD